MKKNPSIMIIAGEFSGDMHAGKLLTALKQELPDASFFGIGGERMRTAGVKTLYDTEHMAVMGFSEVIKRYGFFRRVLNEMIALVSDRRPDAVVLVDYPGFNMRLAAAVHAMGIKVIYYICPQVWAWNKRRIPAMANVLDRLITIFPFEKAHFEGTRLTVDFAGHPLVDEAAKALAEPVVDLPWKSELRIALLPGSRPHEIERIFPCMWEAAEIIERDNPDACFIVAAPSLREEKIVRNLIETLGGGPSRHAIVTDNTRQVLRQARAGIVASGTATIEASLMECPMLIVYKVAWLTYFLGRMLVRVDNIGMVNIVAGKEICPEFIQGRADPALMAKAIAPLLGESSERRNMIDQIKKVNTKLGPGGSDKRAAQSVLAELRRPFVAQR